MYWVFGLLRSAAKNEFYLLLTVEKIHSIAGFTVKYLRPYAPSGINFTTAVNCTNRKTEIQSEIFEKGIIDIQIYFVTEQIFLFC